MGRISQWAVLHPVWAILTWLLLAVTIGVLGATLGGDYNDDFKLPDTESTTAQDLLSELSGTAGTGAGLDGQVVWSPESGSVTDSASQQAMTDLLTKLSKSAGVLCVTSPFGDSLGSGCPEQPAAQGQGDSTQGQDGDQSAGQPGDTGAQASLRPLARWRTLVRLGSAQMARSPMPR